MPEILGLGWAGTRTERFAATTAFFRDVLGLRVVHDTPHQVVFALPDGSPVEVFGPGDPDHDYFSTGPVVEFLVEDVPAARAELEAAGVELLGSPRESGTPGEAWAHFRAPDGNVYGLVSRPR